MEEVRRLFRKHGLDWVDLGSLRLLIQASCRRAIHSSSGNITCCLGTGVHLQTMHTLKAIPQSSDSVMLQTDNTCFRLCRIGDDNSCGGKLFSALLRFSSAVNFEVQGLAYILSSDPVMIEDAFSIQLLLEFTVRMDPNVLKLNLQPSARSKAIVLTHLKPNSHVDCKCADQTDTRALLKPTLCSVPLCEMHCAGNARAEADFALPALYERLQQRIDDAAPMSFLADGLELIPGLPMGVSMHIMQFADTIDLSRMSCVGKAMRDACRDMVPGCRLSLFRHQKQSLQWMLQREQRPNIFADPLWAELKCPSAGLPIYVHTVTGQVRVVQPAAVADCRGGMLCDEPGLGKTVTCIALILKTKGQRDPSPPTRPALRTPPHRSPRRTRSSLSPVKAIPQQRTCTKTTLIIAPQTLVDHWLVQLGYVAAIGQLNVAWVQDVHAPFPSASELKELDVLVTSFHRLAIEWKRFSSSRDSAANPIFTTTWHRILLDEGHKIGTISLTNTSQCCRALRARNRWVITGTPTKSLGSVGDIKYLTGLFAFLQLHPYFTASDERGFCTQAEWDNAVLKPFEQFDVDSLLRLEGILGRVMMRHDKAQVKYIPQANVEVVRLNLTAVERLSYNELVTVIRRNLLLTQFDRDNPVGLLHTSSRQYLKTALDNVRLACCITGQLKPEIEEESLTKCLLTLRVDHDVCVERIDQLDKIFHSEERSDLQCEYCKNAVYLPLVTTSALLICNECAQKQQLHLDPTFVDLQPAFLQFNWRPGWTKQLSTKLRYLLSCIQKLVTNEKATSPAKILVFSQLPFHIERIHRALRDFLPFLPHYDVDFLNEYFATRITDADDQVQGSAPPIPLLQSSCNCVTYHKRMHNQDMSHSAMMFRDDRDCRVMLLDDSGAYGLDLSFVTHIFLMEPIWDASLELQVISRANRMGACQSVEVEKLVVVDSIEELLVKHHEAREHNVMTGAGSQTTRKQRQEQMKRQSIITSLTMIGHSSGIDRRGKAEKPTGKRPLPATPPRAGSLQTHARSLSAFSRPESASSVRCTQFQATAMHSMAAHSVPTAGNGIFTEPEGAVPLQPDSTPPVKPTRPKKRMRVRFAE